jgi:hypothetical protein
MTVEELFVEFGSLVVDETVAVFDTKDAELNVEAFTLMVMITRPPTLTEPRLHVTVPVVCVQVPCVVDEDVYVTAEGNGSETVTPVATAGPLFVTCSV